MCVYRCLELKCRVLWGCPHILRSIYDPPTALHVFSCCQRSCAAGTNECHDLRRRAAALCGQVSAEWSKCPGFRHSALETVWLLCDEAQQVGYLRGLEDRPLVWDTGIQSQFAKRRWWWGQWGGYEHCSTKQERSTLQSNGSRLGWLFAPLLLQHPNQSQQAATRDVSFLWSDSRCWWYVSNRSNVTPRCVGCRRAGFYCWSWLSALA